MYTEYYDVESHLFVAGDLAEAAAAVASMDKLRIAEALGNHADWRATKAHLWKDWIKLCVFAKKRKITGENNFGVTSRINRPLYGPVDATALELRVNQLQAALGIPPGKFKRAFGRVSKFVDDLFTGAKHDIVFKGKWYAGFLDAEIRNIAGGHPYNQHNLPNRLETGVALTVSFDAPWAEHFKSAVRELIELL